MVYIPKLNYEAFTPTPTTNDNIWILCYTINTLRAILSSKVHIAKHTKRIAYFLVISKKRKADLFKSGTLPSAPIFHLTTNTDSARGTYHTPERKVLYKPTVKLAMLMWAIFFFSLSLFLFSHSPWNMFKNKHYSENYYYFKIIYNFYYILINYILEKCAITLILKLACMKKKAIAHTNCLQVFHTYLLPIFCIH